MHIDQQSSTPSERVSPRAEPGRLKSLTVPNTWACPICSHRVVLGATRCPECGARMQWDPRSQDKPAIQRLSTIILMPIVLAVLSCSLAMSVSSQIIEHQSSLSRLAAAKSLQQQTESAVYSYLASQRGSADSVKMSLPDFPRATDLEAGASNWWILERRDVIILYAMTIAIAASALLIVLSVYMLRRQPWASSQQRRLEQAMLFMLLAGLGVGIGSAVVLANH